MRQEGPKLGGMLAQGLDFIVVKLADDDRVYRSKQRCQFRREPAVSVCAVLRPRVGDARQAFARCDFSYKLIYSPPSPRRRKHLPALTETPPAPTRPTIRQAH